MLKTNIKASAITNLTDARYFAAWEVKWLGFSLDQNSDSFIMPQKVSAIQEWVDGVEVVGEFGMQPKEEIQKGIEYLNLTAVQIGHFATSETAQFLSIDTIIKEIVLQADTSEDELKDNIAEFADHVQYFLLNFSKGGLSYEDLKSGKPFPLEVIQELAKTNNILLQIDAEPDQVDDLLTTLQPYGMAVTGGEEEQVGMKTFDELDAFFEAIEVEE